MSSQTRSHSSGSCGCGGHTSTSSGCGCGCGTADCRDGAMVRPLFFAGQLLTEEDLQALSGYVSAKSRLHNRSFFGEGVACGFEVACHPCGEGKVIVRPGHALDCCGNDIVLSAAQTLDINALARELRKKLQGGIDCGDPCADPNKDNNPRQRYCLYVHYCESQTDPVSAFVTDEPCGTAACEPTRVREGLRFELRCRERAKPAGDFLCRVTSCLGDAGQLATAIKDLRAVDHIIQQSEKGLAIEGEDPREAPPFTFDDLRKSTTELEGATPNPDANFNFRVLRNLVTRMDVVRVHLDRYNKLNQRPPIPTDIKVAEALRKAAAFIVLHRLDPGLAPLERSFTRRVVEFAQSAIRTATGTAVELWPPNPNIPPLGDLLDKKLCDLFKLLDGKLDSSPQIVCHFHTEVANLRNLCPPPSDPVFATTIDRAQRLRDAWWHFLQECICSALLPPCPPCDDLGVLLACVEVERCEVVEICNLERTFIPTPVALRHWLPLHLLGDLAEAFCCRELGHLDLRGVLKNLCSVEVNITELARASLNLVRLIADREDLDLRKITAPFRNFLAKLLAADVVPGLLADFAPALLADFVPGLLAGFMPELQAAFMSPPAPAFDEEELISTVEKRLDLAAVSRLENTQKKSAEGLETAQSDLAALRRELEDQSAKNADLEQRLKALEAKNAKASEGRKKP